MVFTTEGLFEAAIESYLEWDLNPRPVNSVHTLLSYINETVNHVIDKNASRNILRKN